MEPLLAISADRATAFRLRRQHLLARAPAPSVERVLAEINGAQAQLLPAARLALWSRVDDLDPMDVGRRMRDRRSLLRAWCMRRTLHLLPSRDAAIYGRGTARRAEKEIRWMLHHGATERRLRSDIEALVELMDRPRSRSELAEALAARLGVRVTSRRGGTGWGSARSTPWLRFGGVLIPIGYALHLAGAEGVVCQVDGAEGECLYVRADAWSRSWREVPRPRAERELLLRYLRSFGPATPRDFAIWTGARLRDAREIWQSARDDLAPVSLEGERAWVVRGDVDALAAASIDGPTVRLLPHFDGYLLGHRDHRNVVGPEHHHRVYRPQGWVRPVLLLNGRVAGVWGSRPDGRTLTIRIEPFARLPRSVIALARTECRALAGHLGYGEPVVRFERPGTPGAIAALPGRASSPTVRRATRRRAR